MFINDFINSGEVTTLIIIYTWRQSMQTHNSRLSALWSDFLSFLSVLQSALCPYKDRAVVLARKSFVLQFYKLQVRTQQRLQVVF